MSEQKDDYIPVRAADSDDEDVLAGIARRQAARLNSRQADAPPDEQKSPSETDEKSSLGPLPLAEQTVAVNTDELLAINPPEPPVVSVVEPPVVSQVEAPETSTTETPIESPAEPPVVSVVEPDERPLYPPQPDKRKIRPAIRRSAHQKMSPTLRLVIPIAAIVAVLAGLAVALYTLTR